MIRFHHRAVPIALAAVLIDSIGFGIVLPVLPSLIVQLGDVSLTDAARIGGYMLIAYAAAQFVAGPIMGSLGDRYGRRPVMLASMLAFGIDYALMAFAPSLLWLFVGRLVAGVTGALYGPANAILADVTPPEKRGHVFGLMGAAFGVGFIIGPAMGGLLSDLGPRAPFLAAAAFAFVNAAAIALLLPETHAPENRRAFTWARANAFGAFKPLFAAAPGAAALLAAALLWQLAHMVYPATWAFWAEIALDWTPREIGWSLATTGVCMAVVQAGLTGRVIAAIGEARTLMLGLCVGVAAFLAYSLVTASWQVYAILILSSLTGVVFPSLNAILSRSVDATNQGALQGGMASLGSIAAVIGPLLLTQALAYGSERGETSGNFLLAAALAAATLLVVWVGVVRRGSLSSPAPDVG
ncbi:MFS transporter [Sphingomonas sp.]|jgi:DHA1 family tetracycline resistance protein-like MFS transporter|uniref:MFS transporter n=1 Tax=Sphingomonas sp. TaxID=28214 RepID=UPI002D7E9FF2|nr:MFS transporter [Sphingomonas sp.]HEU0044597.1 MFS transporter [Sphingomonas sp.]